MKNAVRIFTVVLLALLLCVTMIACSHDEDEHVASGDWQTSATHHWKGCEDECKSSCEPKHNVLLFHCENRAVAASHIECLENLSHRHCEERHSHTVGAVCYLPHARLDIMTYKVRGKR